MLARNNHPRQRQARALARKQGNRPPYARVLIVSEGEKTEPLYFEDIRKQNRVPSAHITVLPGGYGTEPGQVVDFAKDKFLETKAYEWVFAVFDRDEHLTYNDALRHAARLDNSIRNDERNLVRFISVPSVPCFELWLLLHFFDVQAFWDRFEVFRRLKTQIATYEKGAPEIYALTEGLLPDAIRRAKSLQGRFNPDTGVDPYTNVNEVVELLRSIRVSMQ